FENLALFYNIEKNSTLDRVAALVAEAQTGLHSEFINEVKYAIAYVQELRLRTYLKANRQDEILLLTRKPLAEINNDTPDKESLLSIHNTLISLYDLTRVFVDTDGRANIFRQNSILHDEKAKIINKVYILEELYEYDEAIILLKEKIKSDYINSNLEYIAHLSKIYNKLERYRESIELLEPLANKYNEHKFYPFNGESHFNLSEDLINIYINLGDAYRGSGKYYEAIIFNKNVISILQQRAFLEGRSHRLATIHSHLGFSMYKSGNYHEEEI
ncbi:hypothetical protein NF27_DX00010, partial [Candidatus Jidaibacter acanthamoeba]